ncbi:hypothetical protein GE300_03590 [Rhodobacteraceae bacterium 2CG4]|uniref:LarA-like N-terminal domain-containing protein n=1 Tax=Halovulum marinum TaxID=2662447 RepID=A0A6L5YXW9_9RHOB|nr:hypothetical protein [Halovulum marinum]MSU88702.1 hypothetical protein [Halovulum marinum]
MSNAPTFPDIDLPHLADVPLPDLAEVGLRQPDPAPLPDVPAAVRAALDAEASRFDLAGGASVAVAVGSRGIADIDVVARTAVDWLKARGLAPFIVPGMGSHGGGAAEGQAEVLAQLGVTGETMGCPVRATMQTTQYGRIDGGFACHFDANAAGADGVLIIARVKAHTSFDRPVESGLTKMLAVGLGKAEGARQVHMAGPRGLAETLPRLAARVIERAPLCAGLALVETAGKRLHHIEAVAPQDFAAADERLLKIAKAAMARLPFARLDGLIVEQVGKDVSGAGIDPAVSGRTDIRGVANPAEPFIHKIAALGLTDRTGGNGIGVGMADFIPRALAEALDLKAMYMNAVTATILEKAFIPIILPDERSCIRGLVATCWADGPPRIAQIRSSARLDRIRVTAPLLEELRSRDLLLDERPLAPLRFDGDRLARIGRR